MSEEKKSGVEAYSCQFPGCTRQLSTAQGLASHKRVHYKDNALQSKTLKRQANGDSSNIINRRPLKRGAATAALPPSSPLTNYSSSGESVIGMQEGDDGYDTLSDTGGSSSTESTTSSCCSSMGTFGINEDTGSNCSSSESDCETKEETIQYVIPINTGHHMPAIAGATCTLLTNCHLTSA